MVLQSTVPVLCMACIGRIAPGRARSVRVRPKRQVRRWYHRTRDRIVRLSRCGGCCGWLPTVATPQPITISRRRRSQCPPMYGRSVSYPGQRRRYSLGSFCPSATIPTARRRRSSVTCSRVRKISASGRYLEPPAFGNGCVSWPGRRRAFRVRDRTLVAHRLRSVDPHGRQIRCTPDWSENAVSGDHLWVPTSVSGDCCYVGDNDCTKHGPRMKCAACKIISHASCISVLMERSQLQCKPTFRDVGVRQYREQTKTTHHWVHRRTEKGKCKQCGKSLQAKLTFSSKEIVALSCAWCKASYHNKEACFNPERIGEECTLGTHRSIVVPPSWIVKLPRKGNFKSSLRKTPQKKKQKPGKKASVPREPRTFVIKPIPTANITPVLVFINPKSGGNQGAKLLQKFQWLLNPRQVFDLTQGGPRMGLELFRKVPQLRVLACGGDGTVGWVLSVLDQINFVPPPAVGVLPLGTGNDLARALGWGGGYTDEPISKILANIGNSDTVLLDRWNLNVEPNTAVPDADDGKDNLPLNVVNNYFSLGVDAHIALEFHEAREAHPEKFNSRLRNKMFYGQAGGKDLLKRKWKGLAEFVTLECDGKDLTPKLKEHKVHAIVFLNIPSYGGGTHPWNKSGGQYEPATDDGMIEVVGLTTYQLPLLQAGGHGTCITQCRQARIVTSKTIPMQVDGEACKLKPSRIELTLLNKAVMLAKKKPGRANVPQEKLESLTITLMKIMMADYEQHHYDKELLRQSAVSLGSLEVPVTDLEQVRVLINKYCGEQPDSPKLSPDWCFIDSCTAERFFRVDRAQENLHFITDIATDCVFVLDQESPTLPQTPEDEHRRLVGAHGSTATGSLESGDGVGSTGSCSPHQGKQLDRSLSGPPTATGDIPARKSPQGPRDTDGTHPRAHDSVGNGQSLDQMVNYKSDFEEVELPPIFVSSTYRVTPRSSSATRPSSSSSQAHRSMPSAGQSGSAAGRCPVESRYQPTPLPKRQSKHDPSNLLEKTTDAVIKAAKTGDLVMLKDLHLQGYSLLSIDSTGQTALHHGARCGHKDIVRYLISYAPSSIINMIDNESGQTALHKAAAGRQRSICYMLVAGGANLNIQDNDGRTARMLASNADDFELAFYLENQEQFQLIDFRSNNI
uniref:Diacylglycerol kinase n=1 Tax=Anopheles farauti TaxID=69004 RepID=A0A182QAE4_9DIPT